MYSRTIKRYRMVALMAALLALITTLLVPTPAQAGVQGAWETSGGGDYLVIGPDNLPRVLNCGNGGVDAYEQSGDTAWSVAPGTPAPDLGCGNMGSWSPQRPTDTISAAGNMAVSVDMDSSYRSDTIELWDNTGDLLWQHPVLDECDFPAEIGASPIISGGLVVFTYRSCLNWGDYNIMGLDEDDHTVVYDVPLGVVSSASSLMWYEDGVVLLSYGEWRYIANSGIVDQDRSIGPVNGYVITQHVDGSVIYLEHDEYYPNVCYLVFHGVGKQDIQKIVDCETQFNDAKTIPNGDLAAITEYGSDTSSGIVTIFHQANVPHTVINIDPSGMGDILFYGLYGIYVDASGNVLVSFAYTEEIPGDSNQYARAAFRVYDEVGVLLSGWSSDVYGKVSVSNPLSTYLTLSNGRVYFNDLGNSRLISIRIPDISISYVDSVRWGIPANIHQGAKYVAMGDSYSAGTGSFNPDLDEHCKRSTNNYAYYIKNNSSTITDTPDVIACHGAVTADIVSSSNEVSQADMLTLNTEYVTLTIGGNDAGFEEVLRSCVNPDGVLPFFGFGCSSESSVTDLVDERMEALAGTNLVPRFEPGGKEIHSIYDVLLQITTKAPNAKVYIAGYPQLFGNVSTNYQTNILAPSTWSCDVSSVSSYDPVRIDYLDAIWMNDKADTLNSIIDDAVEDLKLLGKKVHYVPSTNFRGHGLCDTDSPWLNGAELLDWMMNFSPHSMHPTVSGYSVGYGDAFVTEID